MTLAIGIEAFGWQLATSIEINLPRPDWFSWAVILSLFLAVLGLYIDLATGAALGPAALPLALVGLVCSLCTAICVWPGANNRAEVAI